MSKLKALVLPSKTQLDNVCPADVYDLINGYFDAEFNLTGADYSVEEQDTLIGDAEVLLTTWGSPVLTAGGLAKAPKLKYVGHAAGTVKSRIPFEAFTRGVRVFSAAPRIAGSVADWCLAAIMTMLRRFPEFGNGLREGGQWKGGVGSGMELTGMKLGIVSLSSTARALLPLLAPFRCDIIAFDPYVSAEQADKLGVKLAPLEDVMARPVVSLHLPQLPATKNMISKEQLARIPDGGILINSSRASVLDEDALIAELSSGRINAALDVYATEPLPAESPLLKMPNILLTPHIAGATWQCYQSLMRCVVENIINAIEGRPTQYEVDPARWDILA